jgi:hypothetical protein
MGLHCPGRDFRGRQFFGRGWAGWAQPSRAHREQIKKKVFLDASSVRFFHPPFFNIPMTQATNNLAAYIWSLADLLRGDFRQSQYGRIILPFTLLRRLEGVLESSKQAVLAEAERLRPLRLPEDAQERLLLRATNGFLSSGMEYVHERNPQAKVVAFGQDSTPRATPSARRTC